MPLALAEFIHKPLLISSSSVKHANYCILWALGHVGRFQWIHGSGFFSFLHSDTQRCLYIVYHQENWSLKDLIYSQLFLQVKFEPGINLLPQQSATNELLGHFQILQNINYSLLNPELV